ncbi:hypothetical protein B0T14DRAFT_522984 [Immersiella caudata]|uniref:Uncharacterized protein n=1 Tax=Immersiella caudata TaxID=314043 RepID=A0AA40BWM6_9PEZI|nr:hypothetical protein B0T14DRAFT_522984 [Immersiella caudata]
MCLKRAIPVLSISCAGTVWGLELRTRMTLCGRFLQAACAMCDLMIEIATVGGKLGLSPASAPSHRTGRGDREEPIDPSLPCQRRGSVSMRRGPRASASAAFLQAMRWIAGGLRYLSSVSRSAA